MKNLIRYLDQDGHEYLEPFERAEATGERFYINGHFVSEEQYTFLVSALSQQTLAIPLES